MSRCPCCGMNMQPGFPACYPCSRLAKEGDRNAFWKEFGKAKAHPSPGQWSRVEEAETLLVNQIRRERERRGLHVYRKETE